MAPFGESECRMNPDRPCRFSDDDVANLISLAKKRDEIVDSINLAQRSTLFPKWALYLMITSMAALFGIALSNRSAISSLMATSEQTGRNVTKMARVMEKHVGPSVNLPTEE